MKKKVFSISFILCLIIVFASIFSFAANETLINTANIRSAILAEGNCIIDTYKVSVSNDGVVTIPVKATNLVAHKNENGKYGYWVGYALIAPGEADGVKYIFAGTKEELGELPTTAYPLEQKITPYHEEEGLAVYTDALAPKTWAKVQWMNGDKAISNPLIYNMDLTEVTLKIENIRAAILGTGADCTADLGTISEDKGVITIPVKATNLVAHKNENGKYGHWVGYALIAPEEADGVKYTFAGTKEALGELPATAYPLEQKITPYHEEEGLAVYTDALAPKIWAKVQWMDGDKAISNPLIYNMDLTEVTLKLDTNIRAAILSADVGIQPTLGTVTEDKGVITIPVKATNLIAHKNENGKYGHWVGYALIAPEEADGVKYTFAGTKEALGELPATAYPLEQKITTLEEEGLAVYTDALAPKTWAKVQWMDGDKAISNPLIYNMDLTEVTLKIENVSSGILSADAGSQPTLGTVVVADGVVTVPLSVSNLISHKRPDDKFGYWIGFALVAPIEADGARYSFAKTSSELAELATKTISSLEINVTADGDKGIAFYTDGAEPSTYVNVQWMDGNIAISNTLVYKMDLSGVTYKKHTVTFNKNGRGTETATQDILYGNKATKPVNPTATSYTFGGWYKEPGCTNAYDFNTPVTADITLYAKWTYQSSSSGGGGGGSSSNDVVTYKITVTEGKHGSISPNGTVKVEKGDNQKFKIKADKGYEIEDVLVDGKSVGAVSSYTFKNVKKKHTIKATFQKIEEKVEEPEEKPEEEPEVKPEVKPTQTNKKYTDVKDNAWHATPIQYVTRNNLMSGVGNDKFSPSNNGTRAMIVTILYNKDGKPTVTGNTNFKDVASGAWYKDSVAWAKANNITSGYSDGTFGPNKPVTREQLAVMLYNYAKTKGNVSIGSAELKFDDNADIHTWAQDAMKWCVSNKIINGKGNNKLDPRGYATRAEIATMIMNFCEMK